MYRASILAIGTELTQGQITNRNAVWISERITELGIEVVAHFTVADDRDRILTALDSTASESELLVVTGGLGPTTDDFTREVLAKWWGAPLEFNSSAWDKIVRRLTERGIEVAASNRQQCFFPRGSEILENLEGTADGFRFRRTAGLGHATEVLVLPGPPREIAHLWERFVNHWLVTTFPMEKTDRETWSCLGKSESSLGEIVEAAVAGYGVKTGYRASVPYVEVKVWIPSSLEAARRASLMRALDTALAPYSVARNGEDLALRFLREFVKGSSDRRASISDLGSAGRLTERLIVGLRSDEMKSLRDRMDISTVLPSATAPAKSASELPESSENYRFILFASGEVAVVGPSGKRSANLPNPYPNPAMAERLGGFRAEMALKVWAELLVELGTVPAEKP